MSMYDFIYEIYFFAPLKRIFWAKTVEALRLTLHNDLYDCDINSARKWDLQRRHEWHRLRAVYACATSYYSVIKIQLKKFWSFKKISFIFYKSKCSKNTLLWIDQQRIQKIVYQLKIIIYPWYSFKSKTRRNKIFVNVILYLLKHKHRNLLKAF